MFSNVFLIKSIFSAGIMELYPQAVHLWPKQIGDELV
jgi:hypothetical protein